MTFSTPTTPRGTKASTAFSLKPPGDLWASEGDIGDPFLGRLLLSANLPLLALGSLGGLLGIFETLYLGNRQIDPA